ncbi:hypothetical protein H1C71_027968 [Ictidomys tridecemlineatus]|nr:hypothetical protein H1C71_027968 [Ictidomys tridecemlineatus]
MGHRRLPGYIMQCVETVHTINTQKTHVHECNTEVQCALAYNSTNAYWMITEGMNCRRKPSARDPECLAERSWFKYQEGPSEFLQRTNSEPWADHTRDPLSPEEKSEQLKPFSSLSLYSFLRPGTSLCVLPGWDSNLQNWQGHSVFHSL